MNESNRIMGALTQIPVPRTPFKVSDIAEVDGDLVRVTLGYPITRSVKMVENQIQAELATAGFGVKVEARHEIPSMQPQNSVQKIDGVKNIIAVASGKGGVGKSTTSANLALALAYEGARVGVLDADIYGPSQQLMFGLGDAHPEVVNNNSLRPLMGHGVQVVSMGSLVNDNTPVIWRGPMVSGTLKQLLTQTRWDDVDYLIVDMPPGTGDIQLTLSQSVPVSTSVIVTTPQDIALLDAKKGIEMFQKVSIPVSGIIENMSVHICSNCGHKEAIFGDQGGANLAKEYGTPLLGRLPLQLSIREQADSGCPSVAKDPSSEESQIYRDIAAKLVSDIWVRSKQNTGPEISLVDD